MKTVTVAELVAFLLTQDQTMPVAYRCFSEAAVLELDDIKVQDRCLPRADGWAHEQRPDKPSQSYLVFPGN
jgi:hypothetical protein